MSKYQKLALRAKESSRRMAQMRRACMEAVGGEPLIFIDGHDDAIVGVAQRDGEAFVVYDQSKVIQLLRLRDGMDEEGAIEFFEFNIIGSCGGTNAPVFVQAI